MPYDVIVVGGSYAGMSATLQLARARRAVMVIDAGVRRNRFASRSHGFLTQDGVDPAQIARSGREQLAAYPTVAWTDGRAMSAARHAEGFAVTMEDGATHVARRLVLAPGVSDTLPDIAGLRERWGKTVFHCPYCHGYELNRSPVGVLAVGPLSMHQALLIPEWGPTTLFLNGAFEPDGKELAQLDRRDVVVERTTVARIGGMADVELADGRTVALGGLFVASRTAPSSPLAQELGCRMEDGPAGPFIQTNMMKETSVAGVFACGDAARAAGSVALAVGDGAMAGAAAHRSLFMEAA